MKRTLVFAALLALAASSFAAEVKLGKPLKVKEPISISKFLEKPDQYVGKTVQVKGKVTGVCQEMGCWMMVADDAGKAVKIKVKDGEIVFPKDSPGKTATVEGTFAKIEMTREQALAQAKHEAEANKRKFDEKTAKVETVTYQINGAGAVIVD